MLYVFLTVLNGAVITMQSSLNGMLYPYWGVLGVGLVSNIISTTLSLSLILITTKRFLKLKGMPFYCCLGGFGSMFVLGFSGLLVAMIGTAVTVCLSVSGQLVMSAVVDHFGLFHNRKLPFDKRRLPCFFCILLGIVIINFLGSEVNKGSVNPFLFLFVLLFAVLVGCVTIWTRMFNLEASRYVGKLGSSFVSSATGMAAGLVLYPISCGMRIPVESIALAPPVAYLTGVMSLLGNVINNVAYSRLNAFHATIFLLIGQIGWGITADLIFLGSFSVGKLLGISVIVFGIFWDKKVTMKSAA